MNEISAQTRDIFVIRSVRPEATLKWMYLVFRNWHGLLAGFRHTLHLCNRTLISYVDT